MKYFLLSIVKSGFTGHFNKIAGGEHS